MANLKNVKINSNTVIDVEGNLFLTEQSSLKDKDSSSIINYNGYWIKPSIVHPDNSLSIDILSQQNSSLDIKNSAEGSASLKVNGVEIVNTNSIVNALTIEDKFLRNDSSDITTGELTAQGGLVTGSSSNKIWVVKKICDGILSSYTGVTFGNKGEYLQFTSSTPILYIPIDGNPGSVITRIRCRFFTAEPDLDILAYSIRKQKEDELSSSIGYEGSLEWRELSTDNEETIDIYDIQDFTIQANYKYWFEIKAQSVITSVKFYSIAYEMSVRKY